MDLKNIRTHLIPKDINICYQLLLYKHEEWKRCDIMEKRHYIEKHWLSE